MASRIQVLDLRDLVDSPRNHSAIADQARTIRVPVHMIEMINKQARTGRQLVQELGREPTSRRLPVA